MKLVKYDNKCVKILDKFGFEYEGNAVHNGIEYNEHEFGVKEEGLQILNFLFYKSIIKKITVLENGFVDDYGLIESEIVNDGIDYIIDAFDYEDDEHICRIIRCIKDKKDLENREEIIKKVKDYLKNNNDKNVKKELENFN